MSKAYATVGLTGLCFLVAVGVSLALDPPHDISTGVDCGSCHTVHVSLGPSLTKDTNANLCMSCHKIGGLAANKPFSSSMQAIPGTSGTSHSWSGAMPVTDNPNNPYGLRSVNSLINTSLKAQLSKFGTCSNPSYTTKSTCETNGGTWTANVACSVCHNQHSQANNPWDPNAPAYGGAGTGSGRHMQRTANDLNQMCEDCHYYRTPASLETDVRTWTGNPKSHPVGKVFSSANGETPNVSDPSQFNVSPLEPQASAWAPQIGARYHQNGGVDINPTNNIVLDESMQVRCLSCHGIHYTDSDSSTVDQP